MRSGFQLNKDKIKILGLYNRSRGLDSCGYYYNGNIEKGVHQEKDFMDFIVHNDFLPGDLDCELFMGHTRKSTMGALSAENAHPYDVNHYVQTHNGVIENIRELTNKYDIKDWYTVDSKGLAYLIEKKGWSVLEEYAGYAALAMTWKVNPNRLYLYHGASRVKMHDKLATIERPLFILHQPEGIYYSSMANSLRAISCDGTEPIDLLCNRVYEIVDGELTEFEYKVDRWYKNAQYEIEQEEKRKAKKQVYMLPASTQNHHDDRNVEDVVKSEPSLSNENDESTVYIKHGRYYSNKKLLEGIYKIDRDCKILIDDITSNRVHEVLYFVKGVMIKSLEDYNKVIRENMNDPITDEFNVALLLSKFSKYPVFCLPEEGKRVADIYKNKWYENGEQIVNKTSFSPKFSNKIYYVERGRTVSIVEDFFKK